jgi:transposase
MLWDLNCEQLAKINQKKVPETDVIFKSTHSINAKADASDDVLRISLDAKASINIGDFSRGGQSRVPGITGYDHDFKITDALIPFGILLPKYDDLSLYFSSNKITSDFIVDVLIQWWETNKDRFKKITTLVINLDNGPDCNSRRTQFMNRLLEMAERYNLNIHLAYYPPYHSKYNPIERVWGVLENHWNGSLLSSTDTILEFAKSMTWKGKRPKVTLIDKVYKVGKKLTAKAMCKIEAQIHRVKEVWKWNVFIPSTVTPVPVC